MIRSLALLFLFCTACTKFSVPQSTVDPSFFKRGESALVPSTDLVSDDCMQNPHFDACVFAKNPVAQEQAPVALSQIDGKRRFGVKLRGLNASGFLENARVRVYSLYAPRLSLTDVPRLKANYNANESSLEQFSAYYWSNRLFDYLEPRVGVDRLPLWNLKIYVDDGFTGYSAKNHSLHLAKNENEWSKAFSGEVVVQLVGQALAHSLSGQKLFSADLSQHNFCALSPKGCCQSIDGCSQALSNSVGDYLAAVMFPGQARLGETVAASNLGQKICGVTRDLSLVHSLTRAQVFAACQPQGRAVLLGTWYASLWWRLRIQLEAQEPGASAEVDKLFLDHVKVWNAQSTFQEAKSEALRLAAEYKNGKYLTEFTTTFGAL